MGVAALVLAAGRGERLGSSLPKAFVPLMGTPLVVRSLETLGSVSAIDLLVPVVPAAERARFDALGLAGRPKLAPLVVGGPERQDSMAAGLEALPDEAGWVAVHDAARCLVSAEDVARVIEAAAETGAALLGSRARDTIKRVRDGLVVETPDRSECWTAETPQVFRVDLLREALAKARAERVVGTDDAQLVERLGVRVRMVESRSPNPKITLPEDLAAAEARLARAAR